jgi:hypothetical protein
MFTALKEANEKWKRGRKSCVPISAWFECSKRDKDSPRLYSDITTDKEVDLRVLTNGNGLRK